MEWIVRPALRRDELRVVRAMDQSVPCNYCDGIGRIDRSIVDIIREAVREAGMHYWPEQERRWREGD